MTKNKALIGIAVLAAGSVLGACGGGSSAGGGASKPPSSQPSAGTPSSGGQGGSAKAQTVSVTEKEMKISPTNPTLKTGSVEFKVKNAGTTAHALAVQGPSGTTQTPTIQPGGSATLKVAFTKPGKYRWYCPVDDHASAGMTGTITVKKA